MYKRILVPLDGSELAEEALPHACTFAKALGAHVLLLRVVVFPDQDLGMIPIKYAASRQVLAEMKRYLEQVAGDLRRAGVGVTTFATGGLVVDTIADFIDDHHVDLVVMATHGRMGAARWLIGSIADRIVHRTSIPVLLVRRRNEKAKKIIGRSK